MYIQYISKMITVSQEEEISILSDRLTLEKIKITEEQFDWKTAIKVAAKPLVSNESIKTEYVDAMIKSVEELGPYIIIAPHIAFAHARPEQGANETDISLMVTKQAVEFSEQEHHHCKIIFVFSAKDSNGHLELLMALSTFLSDEENIQRLTEVENAEQVLQIIQS